MTKKIFIPYFHKGLKFTTPIFFGSGIYLIYLNHPLWGVLVVMTGLIILTTRYVTEINLKTKVCRDYLECLSFSFDEEIKDLKRIDHIVITKGDYSQMMNTRSRSRQLDWVDYTGTLLFENNQTLTLLTKNNKEDLIKGLKEFADFLQVGVEDQTTHHHYWIDLTKA